LFSIYCLKEDISIFWLCLTQFCLFSLVCFLKTTFITQSIIDFKELVSLIEPIRFLKSLTLNHEVRSYFPELGAGDVYVHLLRGLVNPL